MSLPGSSLPAWPPTSTLPCIQVVDGTEVAITNIEDDFAVTYSTPWGPAWIRFDDQGRPLAMGLPGKAVEGTEVADAPPELRTMVRALEEYWSGGSLPPVGAALLDQAGSTGFMRRIYETVSAIPAGSTLTYAQVADAAGRPGAARSVGAAMARNPFAPLIPCHRVVGSDGSLRGYGGGIEMKRDLLEMEGRHA